MSEDIEEREFVRGFNQGYMLKEHRPDIDFAKYSKVDSVFYRGVIAGSKQFEVEQKRSQLKEAFSIDKSKGKERGKDR